MTRAFSPADERAHHAHLVARMREATLRAPVWLLCPRERLRASLEEAVARAGGAFVQAHDWARLGERLDHLLHLPFAAPVDEADRAQIVERALAERAVNDRSLADALRQDPFGLARALLRTMDLVRHHGALPPSLPGHDLAGAHLALLGTLIERLDASLAEAHTLDVTGRLARALAALRDPSRPLAHTPAALCVAGIDRLSPLEGAVLDALEARGVPVLRPAWLRDDAASVSVEAPGDVTCVVADDPHDEAECVARWLAERIADGASPDDFAVAVSSVEAGDDRVRRALARWNVGASGPGAVAVAHTPLWQAVRASVALGWRGVDAIDLATAFSASGSGVFGGDRDSVCARVRRDLPTHWTAVHELIAHATTPVTPVATPGVVALDDDDDAVDPARLKQLDAMREALTEMVAHWEGVGPFARHTMNDRVAALRALVEFTLERFVADAAFAGAMTDPRALAANLDAARSIRAACRVALERVERGGIVLKANDPGIYLGLAESLLGTVRDDAVPPRRDGVTLLVDDPFPASRPKVLVVVGFHRGRLPTPSSPPLLLGSLERERLGSHHERWRSLPDDAARAALAMRDVARTLSLPTGSLVLVRPRRSVSGAAVEVSSGWHALRASAGGALDDVTWIAARTWARAAGSRTRRAQGLDVVAALQRRDVVDAVARAAPVAAHDLAWRDLFAARFRPDARYTLGDLTREPIARAAFTPRMLETLLTCKYRFLTGALLGLKFLPLQRSPTLSGQDRVRVTRALLRRLDEALAAGEDPAQWPAWLDAIITELVPWADRGDARLSLEELRRTVSAFATRYLALRAVWKLDAAVSHEPAPDAPPATITLPGGRVLSLRPSAVRVETMTSPTEGPQSMVLDLSLGTTRPLEKQRALGLDVESAILAEVTAAQPGVEAGVFVRLSLSKPEGEAIARGDDPETSPWAARLTTQATTTVVTLDRNVSWQDHGRHALVRLDAAFDALDQPDGAYDPLDEARAKELDGVGLRPCDRCAMRLGCRFQLAGGM